MRQIKHEQKPQIDCLLAKIMKHSDEGVLLLDSQYNVVFYSPSAATIIGIDPNTPERHVSSIVYTKDIKLINQLLVDLSPISGSSCSTTIRFLHSEGHLIPVQCKFTNLLNDYEVNGITVHFNVINEINEDEKLPSTNHYQLGPLISAFANVSDAVMITEISNGDPAWKITHLNQAFKNMTGFTGEELIDASPRNLQVMLLEQEQLRLLLEAMSRRQSFEQLLRCRRKDGSMFWANCFFSPIKDHFGLNTHWITILRDVTKQKELENLFDKATRMSEIGSWVYEVNTAHIYWSETTKRIYQVPPDFKPDVNNIAPFLEYAEGNHIALKKMSRAIEKGKRFEVEIEILTAKKRRRWVRIIGEPEIISNIYLRVSGSIQNIDQRKRPQLLALRTLKEKNEILESIGDGFFAVDKKWKVLFWNSKAEAELGIKKEKMLERDLWSVFPTSVGSISYKNYQLALKHKKAVHFKMHYKALNRWYDISAYPSAHGLSIYFKNVTAQHTAIKRVIDSEKRYHDLFDLSPLPKWVFDIDTLKILDVNNAAVEHYGYSYEEFTKMTILDIRPKGFSEEVKNTVTNATKVKKFVFQGLFTHLKKNGEQIRVSIQSAPTIFNGKRAKFVIAYDMTEQENYIRAIEEQNAKLKQVSWMQSHVFRAPISKIMGLVELANLTEEGKEKELRLIFNYIREASAELDAAIQQATLAAKAE